MTVKLRPITKLLLAATTVEMETPVVYAVHDGQDFKHPLLPTIAQNAE